MQKQKAAAQTETQPKISAAGLTPQRVHQHAAGVEKEYQDAPVPDGGESVGHVLEGQLQVEDNNE